MDSQIKINALRSAEGITFAHKKDIGVPNGHRLHLNDHVEIYVFIKGDVSYVVDGQYFLLEEGDVLVIPPRCVHVPVIMRECEYERFFMLFPLSSLSAYSSDPIKRLLEMQSVRIRLSEEKRREMLLLLYKMSKIASKPLTAEGELLLHAELLTFLCAVSEHPQREGLGNISEMRIPVLVKNALEYISRSYGEITGIAPIAKRFFVSEQYLATVFKKHVGVTVGEYLQTKKISAAKELLKEGNSVAFTCYECGFSDCSYFIKVFSRTVGETPHRYAKRFEK